MELNAEQPQSGGGIRRWKTVKEVQLFNGNLVLDCPIPPRLLNQIQHAQPPERDEFTHMRYSAATCDPSEFYSERFTLRQKLFAKPRHTELFIVITMYNEEDELFARTMIGVIKNIEYMNSRNSSKTWGKEAWKKIVVCVVSDGRAKINPRTRAVLAGLGVYQDGIAKQQVNGKDVTAHIYEYTTQMTLELKKGVVSVKKGNTPVQMLFCLKEKNQKKINSHRWFFQAFGEVLDPNICVLIDAGTKPGKDSIYKLWKAFDLEPMCAGACGEIKAMLDHGKTLINPLVAAQNFEYKMSNILDKPLESAFGFISVLPGAFSAYRFMALQNDKTGQGPLEKYFAGEKMHGANAGIFTANMYLAEDRILCFELVSKRNCSWILQYVKSATGETDVPTEMADFILQRRRWLNGSFFAAVYALAHFHQIFRSNHSVGRNFMFMVEFFYQGISMLFAWFAIVSLSTCLKSEVGLLTHRLVGQLLPRLPHSHRFTLRFKSQLSAWKSVRRTVRMDLSCCPDYLFRPRARKPTARFEQVLYDAGLLLGYSHGVSPQYFFEMTQLTFALDISCLQPSSSQSSPCRHSSKNTITSRLACSLPTRCS